MAVRTEQAQNETPPRGARNGLARALWKVPKDTPIQDLYAAAIEVMPPHLCAGCGSRYYGEPAACAQCGSTEFEPATLGGGSDV